MSIRRFCAVGFLLAGAPLQAQVTLAAFGRDSQTVVFVCEHGTVKSVIAMSYFAKFARERGFKVRAVSRGVAPDSAVPSVVRKGLQGDGVFVGVFTPTQFSAADLTNARAVVSFDQPAVAATVRGKVPTLAWNGMPAVSDSFPVARDSIRARVSRLVDSLKAVRRR